ncbi:ATP-dependent helicase/nuclease subunit A [Halarchaeum rubridurum]|uniref:DNA 3'-5' helicase n=1 Tax=Halarchaeum rubridurum TaxID=489911 RepID=A0A830FNL6_9EURY|nr:UvrD-helicase domain-containing protein [Halarchaeum rubridurum]MBP1953526.1 ATP-dependent helicase/nuclease subunit A [Halarchaeum rubridurum]GGM64567.1 hypothetical protein GCM10009017_13330 [Halarchaeum rubridurum]
MTASGVDEVPELRGAQRRLRDAFLAHDAGLFVLDCNPGAGKSTVADRLAAAVLARGRAAGERAPERGLCVTSFARDDAAAVGPGVAAALDSLAAREDVGIDAEDASDLARRLRRSDTLGTVDSVLHTVFADVAHEVGFDGVPTVGDATRLAALESDCLDALRDDPEHAARVERLEAAYPGGEHTAGLDDLLPAMLRAARQRRLSVDAFADRLRDAVDGAYPEGAPEDFADVLRDVERFVDRRTADETAAGFDADARAAFVAADRACHESWRDAVDDLQTFLAAYEEAYDALTRERGLLTHLDVAHWTAAYFEAERYASDYRAHVRERYTARLDTVIVDEAQDVSVVQHDALAPFVDSDTRVLLVGDRKQCIYTWRNASPERFARAAADGDYFGVDWDVHVRERAARTYRSRPDVAAAVDAVFADAFADPARAGGGAVGVDYPHLVADREATAEPSVHVAAHGASASPGSRDWAAKEARALASYLAGAFAGGTFDDENDGDDGDERPSVTVLFPRRTRMGTFAEALTARGFAVADASERLFARLLVRLAAAVARWLVDPSDTARTRALLDADLDGDGTTLPTALRDAVADADWSVRAAASGDESGLDDPLERVLDALAALAGRRARHVGAPVATVDDVLDTLDLAADPLDLAGDDPSRRVAALDALRDGAAEWAGEDGTLDDLAAALGRFLASPGGGPEVPVPDTESHDVVFRTVHGMKGDEADVVALADLGAWLGFHGPHGDAFVARGEHLALAPPADAGDDAPPLAGFDAGVYAHPSRDPAGDDPDDTRRDAGLRWASERWVPGEARLAGPPPLAAAAGAQRAERWRVLYVAMTRARDHLVVPLPGDRDPARRRPRENWADALADAFEVERATRGGTHTVASPRPDDPERTFAVGVNDVPLVDRVPSRAPPPTPAAATPTPRAKTGWTPRHVNASTLYPLVSDPEKHVLAHLQRTALHTARAAPPDELGLPFDALGPDAVGTVAHAVLTRAVSLGVETTVLAECAGPLRRRLDEALAGRGAGDAERAAVRAFVAERVCPQFAASETWARLRESESVFVEESVDAVVRVSERAVAVEMQNVADVVSRAPDGTWRVDDLKVALAPSDGETRRRYDLQAATYAWLLERQVGGSVSATVTRLGVDPTVRRATPPDGPVGSWFASLAGLLGD